MKLMIASDVHGSAHFGRLLLDKECELSSEEIVKKIADAFWS